MIHSLLDLIPDPGSNDLAGSSQASLICDPVPGRIHIRRHIVRIDAYDIPQGRITLQGQVFLIVVNIEHRLGRIHHSPHDRDADLHRIAEAVIDLLPVIIECHDLKRDLLSRARHIDLCLSHVKGQRQSRL